jgi:hypothetical protein
MKCWESLKHFAFSWVAETKGLEHNEEKTSWETEG